MIAISYAIIRNEKYTKEQMIQLSPHNERHKQNYSNKNINLTKTYLNYHLKKPQSTSYMKEFKRIKQENNLKGQLHSNSIYACEFIITSDKNFFNTIGINETKRYFETAYEFVCNYNNLNEKNIISAVVHMDEETPHMHLVYVPVVTATDKEGNTYNKISASEFWKGKNSYSILQDSFFEHMSLAGFELERGKTNPNREYKSVEELKELTNFYDYKEFERKLEIAINNYNELLNENESLKSTINNKENQIKVYENLIIHLSQEKDALVEKAKRMGIDLENKEY